MAQKFSNLEEAAQQLGISKDRLNDLREAGKIRAYRDGASWKFRSDDIERISSEGIPTIDPPASDIDLGSGLSLDSGISSEQNKPAAPSGLDLDLADEVDLPGPASDLNLDDIEEPTVPAAAADESEEVLAIGEEEDLLDISDSILLSEKSLGAAGGRPPSTIIGKAELDPDGDLDLTLRGSDNESTQMSDVKLAATSDVLSGGDSLDLEPPSPSDNFQGLAEVDVDLEAESSRVHPPGETAKGKGAAKAKQAPPSSGLQLAPSDSDAARASSDIGLGGSDIGAGLTGLSALELADDDEVLGEGSDITLSSESSGINIISPSDSGLALDEVALSSASMSSPLDLGGAVGEDITLEPLELSDDAMEGEEPFQLTPLGEAEDEEKDSSQVIALDDIGEEEEAAVFHAEEEQAVAPRGDFIPAGIAGGMAPIAAPAEDVAMSGAVVGLLACGLVLLLVCGMMMFDLVRNIWSWDSVHPINGTLLEVVKFGG
jgi:excisionase family DNA binding protein